MKEEIALGFKQIINSICPINEAEWNFLSENITIREVKKKTLISRQGDTVKNFTFLASGAIRLYFKHEKKEFTHQVYTNQRFIVDVIALKRQEPTKFYMEALTDCWVLEISADFMTSMLLLSPTFEKITRHMYEDAVMEEMERVMEILSLGPFEQYQKFMEKHGTLATKLTQVKTALCLNITQESFSRFKSMTE